MQTDNAGPRWPCWVDGSFDGVCLQVCLCSQEAQVVSEAEHHLSVAPNAGPRTCTRACFVRVKQDRFISLSPRGLLF